MIFTSVGKNYPSRIEKVEVDTKSFQHITWTNNSNSRIQYEIKLSNASVIKIFRDGKMSQPNPDSLGSFKINSIRNKFSIIFFYLTEINLDVFRKERSKTGFLFLWVNSFLREWGSLTYETLLIKSWYITLCK